MKKLTKMQQKVYDYIAQFMTKWGYPPSVREICAELLPRTIDALRPLAQGPAHLYRAVVTEESPYLSRDLRYGVGGKLRSICKVKSLNSL